MSEERDMAIAQAAMEADAAQDESSPLDRYTAAFQALNEFEMAHAAILSELDALQQAKAEAEEALKVHARQIGNHSNELFNVIVQERVSLIYDGQLLIDQAHWLVNAGVCTPKYSVEVDVKKLETLLKKEMLPAEVLEGVVTEKALTPAVLIRPKFGR